MNKEELIITLKFLNYNYVSDNNNIFIFLHSKIIDELLLKLLTKYNFKWKDMITCNDTLAIHIKINLEV